MAEGNGNLDQRVSLFGELKAASFYNGTDYVALREAKKHIAEGGFITTLQQIVRDRINQQLDDKIWQRRYTANSEEYLGRIGKEDVIVVVHGGALLSDPAKLERIVVEKNRIMGAKEQMEELMRRGEYEAMNTVRAQMYEDLAKVSYILSARVQPEDMEALARGKMSDGKVIPTFTIEQYMQMEAAPRDRHAIVAKIMRQDIKDKPSDNPAVRDLIAKMGRDPSNERVTTITGINFNGQLGILPLTMDIASAIYNPLFVMRAGGNKNAKEYTATLSARGAKKVSNFHHLSDFNPKMPIGYLLQIGTEEAFHGFCPAQLGSEARFIAVKLSPEIEEAARRSYFNITLQTGNGNGHVERGPEVMTRTTGQMTPATPSTPPPPPRVRKTTMGGNDPAILPPPPRRNGSGGKA